MSSDLDNKPSSTQNPELEELKALKEELLLFASLINHDFKEPIRTISAFSSLIQRRIGDDDPKSAELIGFVQDGAHRMSIMVDGLVEYIRIERYMDEAVELDLNNVLQVMNQHFSDKIKEKKAEIHVKQLPTVRFPRKALKTLFKHLIDNGLNFQENNNSPVLHFSSEENEQGYTIRCSDNGIGIPPEMTEQIFRPFRRLNAIGTYKGCGLGLASCKKIMDLQGGRIWAEPNPDTGLTVCLFFPK